MPAASKRRGKDYLSFLAVSAFIVPSDVGANVSASNWMGVKCLRSPAAFQSTNKSYKFIVASALTALAQNRTVTARVAD
jgi:hypothetical protein